MLSSCNKKDSPSSYLIYKVPQVTRHYTINFKQDDSLISDSQSKITDIIGKGREWMQTMGEEGRLQKHQLQIRTAGVSRRKSSTEGIGMHMLFKRKKN